jgi:predicted dehydrogenase
VRWTEQRNMEGFLDLVAADSVQPSRLVTHRFPIAEADRAYQVVAGATSEPYLGIVLEYPRVAATDAPLSTRVDIRHPGPRIGDGVVRLGVVGAGNFARSVLLPNLKKLGGVELRGVATASAPSAQQTASRFDFAFTASDWRQIVEDPTTDAVVVATRHDLHASVAAAALRAGKSVFLEKPMALSLGELDELMDTWRSSGGILQVGFNRRFAPTYQRLKSGFAGHRPPLVMAYRVNAGSVAASSWVVDPVQGGGRLVGEACHMLDVLVDLAGAPIVSVYTQPLGGGGDDVVLSLAFGDGSIATLTYASGGDRGMPKEYLEVLGGGRSAVLDDFRTLRLYAGGSFASMGGRLSRQDKGHSAELRAFLEAVRKGAPSPVDPEQAAHVTRATFAAVESARTGLPVAISP